MLCDWAVAGGEEEDVAMLVLEPSSASTVQPDQPSSSSFMGRVQQYVLGAFVSRVVIRWRIPVISEFLRVCVCVCICVHATLRTSLAVTFLQTLPDLVTPLKGHSLSPRSCPPTWSAPSERFGY